MYEGNVFEGLSLLDTPVEKPMADGRWQMQRRRPARAKGHRQVAGVYVRTVAATPASRLQISVASLKQALVSAS
jgi:hypothetical protein